MNLNSSLKHQRALPTVALPGCQSLQRDHVFLDHSYLDHVFLASKRSASVSVSINVSDSDSDGGPVTGFVGSGVHILWSPSASSA